MGAYETDLLQTWEKNTTKPSELMQDFRGLGTIMPNPSSGIGFLNFTYKKKKKKLCFVLSWLITFFPEPQQCSTISSRKKNIQVSAHKKTDKPSTSHCQWHTSPQTKPRQGRLPLLKEQQQGVLAVTSQHQSLVLPDH